MHGRHSAVRHFISCSSPQASFTPAATSCAILGGFASPPPCHKCNKSTVYLHVSEECETSSIMPSHRKYHDSASSSTEDSSPKYTPSPRSSHSSDGLSIINEPNTIELRTIRSKDERETKDEGEEEEDDDTLSSARRASIDSAQSYELYTPDEDRLVLKKLDRKLVAFMALLYCLSFLDRSSE
jgi:hypothetical protein